jgi:PLD-like domain
MITCALGPDNIGPLLCGTAEGAANSLDVAVYELGPSYVSVLKRAIKSGVRLRVLLDGGPVENLPAARALAESGAQVRLLSLPHAYLHWKFLIADSKTVALGTGNLIQADAPYEDALRMQSGFAGTREWWVRVPGNPALAAALEAGFESRFEQGRPPVGTLEAVAPAREHVGTPPVQVGVLDVEARDDQIELAVSGAGVFTQLEDTMAAARSRLWVTVPYIFTGGDRVRGLLAKVAGADAKDRRILLGEVPHSSDRHALSGLGAQIRVMNPSTNTRGHAKGAVVDRGVIVTSANWSEPGLSANDEAGVMVNSPPAAEYFAQAFERDWDLAEA